MNRLIQFAKKKRGQKTITTPTVNLLLCEIVKLKEI
nr:MAG TPA: hypothetical protein [Bacteriophage sp.]